MKPQKRPQFQEQLKRSLKSEEFDKDYVLAVQKLSEIEVQKTIRHYQTILAIIKVASKIALVLNVRTMTSYLTEHADIITSYLTEHADTLLFRILGVL